MWKKLSVTSHDLYPPLPCHKLSHFLRPPPPWSVIYFMDGPVQGDGKANSGMNFLEFLANAPTIFCIQHCTYSFIHPSIGPSVQSIHPIHPSFNIYRSKQCRAKLLSWRGWRRDFKIPCNHPSSFKINSCQQYIVRFLKVFLVFLFFYRYSQVINKSVCKLYRSITLNAKMIKLILLMTAWATAPKRWPCWLQNFQIAQKSLKKISLERESVIQYSISFTFKDYK